MIVMNNIYAKGLELMDEFFNFFLVRVTAEIADFFVPISGHDFINDSSEAIGECDFGFISRAQSKDPFVIFSPIETPAVHFGILSRLNEDFS